MAVMMVQTRSFPVEIQEQTKVCWDPSFTVSTKKMEKVGC